MEFSSSGPCDLQPGVTGLSLRSWDWHHPNLRAVAWTEEGWSGAEGSGPGMARLPSSSGKGNRGSPAAQPLACKFHFQEAPPPPVLRLPQGCSHFNQHQIH